jgi:hypothetical protein
VKTKTLVIGLLTDRIDVLLCAGAQVLDGRRIALPLEQDAAKWPRQVRDAAKAVRDAAGDMGARGLQARVLYRGPTAVAEYASPRVKSPRDAGSAAILTCSDSLSCPLDAAAARAALIGCEKGDQPKAHVIVAADGDDALTAIREMIDEAGLTFASATPIDAALMARASRHAVAGEAAPIALLYVGEHRSFLAIAVNRGLVFARPISVGLDTLVSSLMRPLRLAGGQTLELSRDKAREIIHACGFPSRSQIVDEELELTGGQIIPLLQPALQRCMVELRQSLRFALPENQRLNVTLKLLGPGSRTPGFTQIAADELGVPVDADERYRAFDYREPASAGSELADAIDDRKLLSELALEPQAVSRSRRLTTMKRWLWTGAAAALAMIAFDAVRFHGRLSQVREQADALQTQNQGLQALKVTADRLLATSAAMTTLENAIRKETGAQVFMGAALQEISRLTPPSIRLGSISFKPGGDVVMGTISGYAMDERAASAAGIGVLESYIAQLRQSPLLERLVLSNVQATVTHDQPAQSFDVMFAVIASPLEIVSAPDAAAVPSVDAAAEASAPAGGNIP